MGLPERLVEVGGCSPDSGPSLLVSHSWRKGVQEIEHPLGPINRGRVVGHGAFLMVAGGVGLGQGRGVYL